MAYDVFISPAARRDLKRIRGPIRRRIAEAIDGLAEEPRSSGHTKLVDEDHLYRIRVGDYRIVYQIEDDRLVVLVVRVGHRKDIYRGGR
jgi:mRNA interferase RelE/StbE